MRTRILILLLAALPVAAQTPAAQTTTTQAATEAEPTVQAPIRIGVSGPSQELSLTDAIERAMRANLEIRIERTNVETTTADETGALGYMDPVFRFTPRYESRTSPTASSLIGTDGKLDETAFTTEFSYAQRLPWYGSSLNLGYTTSRQTTTNPFNALSPYQTGAFTANFRFPLLRNRDTDQQRANLRIIRTQSDLSETQLETKVIDVVSRVEVAYWNLVAARQNVSLAEDSVNLARAQRGQTQRMIDSGMQAPIELSAADAELERRVDTWHAAAGLVTELENVLKTLITEDRNDALWNSEIVPSNQQTSEAPSFDSVGEAVDLAVTHRPELRQLDSQEDANQIRSELAANQTRPGVNVVAGYTSNGLAGSVVEGGNPFSANSAAQIARINELSTLAGLEPLAPPSTGGGVPEALIGGFGSVNSEIFRSSYPTAFVGVEFDVTGRNRSAEAELAKTAITGRRLQLQRAQIETQIASEVRTSLQAIETARQRIIAADASVRAAQEKLDSETRLFETGESTNFLVLTRQNELADSRQRAIVARLDFNKAVAQAIKALGTTLEAHSITVE